MTSRAFLTLWACVLALALGCAVTDYPIVTDDRGDYSGVIRTGHKAYIQPSTQAATIWSDGTDEIFSMVYQNSYGDQKLYSHNNFDPSGSVFVLDQTYCDWKFDGCEFIRAWNPVQNDEPYDYELFEDCSGARSLTFLVAYTSRIGECGDAFRGFRANLQELAEAFSNLPTTTWRGEQAYQVPLDATNFSVTLVSASGESSVMPVFGRYDLLLTERFEMAAAMTPNARHQISWIANWVAENGPQATLRYQYEGVQSAYEVRFRPEGLAYNTGRF